MFMALTNDLYRRALCIATGETVAQLVDQLATFTASGVVTLEDQLVLRHCLQEAAPPNDGLLGMNVSPVIKIKTGDTLIQELALYVQFDPMDDIWQTGDIINVEHMHRLDDEALVLAVCEGRYVPDVWRAMPRIRQISLQLDFVADMPPRSAEPEELAKLTLEWVRIGLANAGTPDADREITTATFVGYTNRARDQARYVVSYNCCHERIGCGWVYASYDRGVLKCEW